MKRDYLAFAVTVVDLVDGAAYLFEKDPPEGQRNWKAELELEQLRNVLEPDQNTGRKKIIKTKKQIEERDVFVYNRFYRMESVTCRL